VAAHHDLEKVFARVLGKLLARKVLDGEQIRFEVMEQREFLLLECLLSATKSLTRSQIKRQSTRQPCWMAS
jgi:hypothetical protein